MMVVMSEPTEVIQRNHFEVRARHLRRKFLADSLQDARTRFLLNPNCKGELSALFLLLRRDLVVGDLPVYLALLLCTHVQDRSCFTTVYDNGDLGVWALSLAPRMTVLTFVERAGHHQERGSQPVAFIMILNSALPFVQFPVKSRAGLLSTESVFRPMILKAPIAYMESLCVESLKKRARCDGRHSAS